MAAPLVMRGTVTARDGRLVDVEVPELGTGVSFGPCETTTTGPLEKGDRVLVVAVSGIPEDLVVIGVLNAGHDEDRFYTKAQADARFAPIVHNHDSRYFTETEADARFAPIVHTHDDRYFTESEVTTLLAGKAAAGHTHL